MGKAYSKYVRLVYCGSTHAHSHAHAHAHTHTPQPYSVENILKNTINVDTSFTLDGMHTTTSCERSMTKLTDSKKNMHEYSLARKMKETPCNLNNNKIPSQLVAWSSFTELPCPPHKRPFPKNRRNCRFKKIPGISPNVTSQGKRSLWISRTGSGPNHLRPVKDKSSLLSTRAACFRCSAWRTPAPPESAAKTQSEVNSGRVKRMPKWSRDKLRMSSE